MVEGYINCNVKIYWLYKDRNVWICGVCNCTTTLGHIYGVNIFFSYCFLEIYVACR